MNPLSNSHDDHNGQATATQVTLTNPETKSSQPDDTDVSTSTRPNHVGSKDKVGSEMEFEKPSVGSQYSPNQVTQCKAQELDNWRERREAEDEPYAFYHLSLHRYTDLTTDAKWLDATAKIRHDTSFSKARTCAGTSFSSPNEDTVAESIISWYLDLMAAPHHKNARPISADNIRIFVADQAIDALSDAGVEISPLIEKLHDISEHNPSPEYVELLDEHRKIKTQCGSDSGLSAKIRQIEATVRSKFGFSRKYGGPTPDPHEDYEHLPVDQLKDELEDARAELEQKKARADELSTMLDNLEQEWESETRDSLFSTH